jgi:hypothetical protein
LQEEGGGRHGMNNNYPESRVYCISVTELTHRA